MIDRIWALARQVDTLRARAKVIATSVVTVAAVIASALQVVIVDLSDTWPDGSRWAAQAAAVLFAVIAVIRRVTPVGAAERGVLPKT